MVDPWLVSPQRCAARPVLISEIRWDGGPGYWVEVVVEGGRTHYLDILDDSLEPDTDADSGWSYCLVVCQTCEQYFEFQMHANDAVRLLEIDQ